MGLTLNLKQSKVTICIVLQGLKEVIMNTFATAIMLTVVTLLFMPTTSQPTPSDQPHTEHPEGTRGPSGQLQEEIKKEIIEARKGAVEAINGITSLLANMLTPIVKIIQTESMFSERIEHMREQQQQREEGEEERDEDKLWEAKDEMMREVLMEEGKKYADVMKRLATAIEGPEFWDSPIESFLKALMSTVHKGESEEKREEEKKE